MGMGGLYEVEQLVAEGVSRDEADGTVASSPALAEIQVDVASAFQFYSSASARGHLLATHRLAQIQLWGGSVIEERADQASIAADRAKGIMSSSFAQRKANRRGRGGAVVPRSCESAAAAFKNVAERGDWALQLNTAHSLYSAGDRYVFQSIILCFPLSCILLPASALSILDFIVTTACLLPAILLADTNKS